MENTKKLGQVMLANQKATSRSPIKMDTLFNCTDLSMFVESILQELPFDGSSGSKFYACRIKGVSFLTKMCFYKKSCAQIYTDTKNLSQTDVEIQILTHFKERFIDTNVTPCIIELIGYKVCDGMLKNPPLPRKEHLSITADLKNMMSAHSDMVSIGVALDRCAFLVLDRCDITFDLFMRRNQTPVDRDLFKGQIFMVLYTLYVITKIYPNFKHNDLHTKNVMMKFEPGYVHDPARMIYYAFPVKGKLLYVPYYGVIPKIIDFGFAVLPEKDIISVAVDDKVSMYYSTGPDYAYLFRALYSYKHQYIHELLDALDPKKFSETISTTHKNEKKMKTYEEMLLSPVWEYSERKKPYREFMPV